MPYATNPVDGVRTYFEDAGGNAPAVLFYTASRTRFKLRKPRTSLRR